MTTLSATNTAARELIVCHGNRSAALDYVTSFSGQLTDDDGSAGTVTIDVRYVPDKLVLDTTSLPDYLAALGKYHDLQLEELAGAILEDLNNEVVPRWLHVTVSSAGKSNGTSHSVTFEDRQPNWDNPSLLSRLTSI